MSNFILKVLQRAPTDIETIVVVAHLVPGVDDFVLAVHEKIRRIEKSRFRQKVCSNRHRRVFLLCPPQDGGAWQVQHCRNCRIYRDAMMAIR